MPNTLGEQRGTGCKRNKKIGKYHTDSSAYPTIKKQQSAKRVQTIVHDILLLSLIDILCLPTERPNLTKRYLIKTSNARRWKHDHLTTLQKRRALELASCSEDRVVFNYLIIST